MTVFKKAILCLLLIGSSICIYAQTNSPLPWNWAKNHYGTADDRCNQVISDPLSGGIYSWGSFMSYNFQVGSFAIANTSQPGSQSFSYYLAKHDAAGNVLWAQGFPTEVSDVRGACLDAQGNLYLTAQYWGTLTIGSVSLSASQGNIEFCIIKYSPSGNVIWMKEVGTDNSQTFTTISGMTAWDSGHLAVSGLSVSDTLGNFPIITTGNFMWNGATWLAKMDTAGNFTNLVMLYDTLSGGSVQVNGVSVDPQKNLYIIGGHSGNPISSAVWQLGIGTASTATERTFIAKFGPNLSFIWSRQAFASSGLGPAFIQLGARGLAIDPQGNPFFLGKFSADSLAFDASHGHNLSAAWSVAHPMGEFLVKYSPSGSILWDSLYRRLPNVITGMGGICTDKIGNVYCVGAMCVPFGITFNGMTVAASGNGNIFVAKFGPDGKAIWLQRTTLSGSQGAYSMCEDGKGNIYIGGRFVLGNAGFGATTLTVTPPAPNYPYDGDAFIARLGNCSLTGPQLQPNTAQHLCNNAALILSTAGTGSLSYIWSTGSTSPSITVSQAGSYYVSVVDSNGCYASSAPLMVTTGSVNNSISISGNTLTSAASGATYQWLDCSSAYQAVGGAVTQTFIPAQSGSYALLITQNGCSDTSACLALNLDLVSLAHTDSKTKLFRISPNPFQDELLIESTDAVELILHNALGREVFRKPLSAGEKNRVFLPHVSPGMYIATAINTTGEKHAVKIVKE